MTKGTKGAFSVGILSQMPQSLFAATDSNLVTMPIGFQSYVLRGEIGKDIVGTLNKTKAMGYEYVEMCSPSGYMGPFEPLAKHSGKELKKIIKDCGMKCNQQPSYLDGDKRKS